MISTPTVDSPESIPITGEIPTNLSIPRNVKIGMFHVGSSMADILASGVWNRVAIVELGFAATPISLLLGLRYFLSPLSIWAGQRSDTTPYLGYRRLPYIWGGRLLMMVSFMLLGFSTVNLFETGSGLGAFGLLVGMFMFSLGGAISGTTFLALIYDVTPRPQQTRAISLVWFFLIAGFAISGVVYGRLLPEYTRDGFLTLFIVAPLIMGAFWVISLLGEERRVRNLDLLPNASRATFFKELGIAWSHPQTRIFLSFLALTTGLFYTQDAILEPFAGTVFKMETAITSRFSAYWGSMALLGIIVCILLARKFPARVTNTALTRIGVVILVIAFGMFAICAFAEIRGLVTIGLIVLGIGLGAWTVGTLGLMMDMTRAAEAGLYLSLWTVSETLARGAGVSVGGILLDLGLVITRNAPFAYGMVFLFQTAGFAFTLWLLTRINVVAFQQSVPSTQQVAEAVVS
jgi:BCD family chlorophyll transporter-like MFS transporter